MKKEYWEKPFNPTMVWFYHTMKIRAKNITKTINFQSHYGLILSHRRPGADREAEKAFNPTMVWFYLSLCNKISKGDKNFQSHYGLILSS